MVLIEWRRLWPRPQSASAYLNAIMCTQYGVSAFVPNHRICMVYQKLISMLFSAWGMGAVQNTCCLCQVHHVRLLSLTYDYCRSGSIYVELLPNDCAVFRKKCCFSHELHKWCFRQITLNIGVGKPNHWPTKAIFLSCIYSTIFCISTKK